MFPKRINIKRKAVLFSGMSVGWLIIDILVACPLFLFAKESWVVVLAWMIISVHIPLLFFAIWFWKKEEPRKTVIPAKFFRKSRKKLY